MKLRLNLSTTAVLASCETLSVGGAELTVREGGLDQAHPRFRCRHPLRNVPDLGGDRDRTVGSSSWGLCSSVSLLRSTKGYLQ